MTKTAVKEVAAALNPKHRNPHKAAGTTRQRAVSPVCNHHASPANAK